MFALGLPLGLPSRFQAGFLTLRFSAPEINGAAFRLIAGEPIDKPRNQRHSDPSRQAKEGKRRQQQDEEAMVDAVAHGDFERDAQLTCPWPAGN
jgi:hypothetical protein